MADLAEVLSTYQGLVGVTVGAGLTYWLGAVNRRHQEARENETRWYETRLQAYVDLSRAVTTIILLASRPGGPSFESYEEATVRLVNAVDTINLVGSKEAADAAEHIYEVVLETGMIEPTGDNRQMGIVNLRATITQFHAAARKDLGHPRLSLGVL
jgi:hypothetical protein